MKKREVVLGELYRVSYRGNTIIVRLTRERGDKPGWEGLDITSRRPITIAAAARIQTRCDRNGKALPAAQRPAKARRKSDIARTVDAVEKGDLTKGVMVPAGKRRSLPGGQAMADKARGAQLHPEIEAERAAERAAAPDAMTASERAMSASAEARKRKPRKMKAAKGKPAKGKRGKPAKAKAAKGKPATARRRGILDIAVDLLAEIGQPRTAAELVTQALQRSLWTTKGKTPAATLNSAIIREIAAKGKQSRFRKTGPATFEISDVGKAAAKAAR